MITIDWDNCMNLPVLLRWTRHLDVDWLCLCSSFTDVDSDVDGHPRNHSKGPSQGSLKSGRKKINCWIILDSSLCFKILHTSSNIKYVCCGQAEFEYLYKNKIFHLSLSRHSFMVLQNIKSQWFISINWVKETFKITKTFNCV